MNTLKRLLKPKILIGLAVAIGLMWGLSAMRRPAVVVSDSQPAVETPAPKAPASKAKPEVIWPAPTELMREEFLTLWQEATVGSILQMLRQRGINPEEPLTVYVVDQIGRLQGSIITSQLLDAAGNAPLKGLVNTDVLFIPDNVSGADAIRLLEQTKSEELPVTDSNRKVVGLIDTVEYLAALKAARAAAAETQAKQVRAETVSPPVAEAPKPPPTVSPSPPARVSEPPRAPVTGTTFINGLMAPMDYELNERFWGWRPNDLIRPTDNVNNFQLGVLETTRRAAVHLAESISRTGNVESFDPNVEQAMNWFMVRPTQFWLPSAERKYKDALKELERYQTRLTSGKARFFNRSDNLLPLLRSLAHLLGSCDDMLTRQVEEDGSPVSFFKVDDYFFYSQGVGSAMLSILKGVQVDFAPLLRTRNAETVLQVIINNLEFAVDIRPWIILDSSYSSIFANHRANLVAPLSNARFNMDILIETLST